MHKFLKVRCYTSCFFLNRLVLCTKAFWWHFLLYYDHKIVERFFSGFPRAILCGDRFLSTVVYNFLRPSVCASRRHVWNMVLWGPDIHRSCVIGGSTMVWAIVYIWMNLVNTEFIRNYLEVGFHPRSRYQNLSSVNYLSFQFIMYVCTYLFL